MVRETGTPESTREKPNRFGQTSSVIVNGLRLNVRAYPSPLPTTIKPPPKTAKNKFKIIGIFTDIHIVLRKRYML